MTCTRWHRLGERCECGRLTIPTRFYYKETGQKIHGHAVIEDLSHDKAEAAYLELRGERLVLPRAEELEQIEKPHTTNKKPYAKKPKRLRRK